MPKLVPVRFEDMTLWIEAADPAQVPGRSAIAEASAADVGKRALATADEMTATIKGFCGRLIGGLKELNANARPDKAEIEFGLNISAEGNVYVVKGSAEASLKITAEWDLTTT